MLHASHRLRSLSFRGTEHHKIIGIAHEAIAVLVELPVQINLKMLPSATSWATACMIHWVRQVIEEAFNVCVQNHLGSLGVGLQNCLQCHVTITSRPETIGRVMKQRFKDRVQKAANHLLSNTVSNRWNPQRAFTGLILGDVNSSESLRLKTTCFQVPHQGLNIVEKVSLEHLDA